MSAPTPEIGLVIVGDEILSGKRADKHLPKLIELLSPAACKLSWADYVGDSPSASPETLKRAFASKAIVFSCGGIGATPDDHTRQCAGKALGVPSKLHPRAEALIRERMQDTAKEQASPTSRTGPTTSTAEHGRVPGGRRDHPQPVQQDPGFTVAQRPLRPRLPGDGPGP
jgi:molybdopterin-biosynthesis enzyme MoeA-like protein